MIIKGTKQLGSFRKGINLSPLPEIRARENRLAPPTPTPTPAAEVCVSNSSFGFLDGTYTYNAATNQWIKDNSRYLFYYNTQWIIGTQYEGGGYNVQATNSAPNGINPPTTGWIDQFSNFSGQYPEVALNACP